MARTVPVAVFPAYHFTEVIADPAGVNRHASFVAVQLGSVPFLPGTTTAAVPVAFCKPIMAFP